MKTWRFIIALGTSAVVIGLLIVSVVSFVYRDDIQTGAVIADEVKKLTAIFARINKKCGIFSFDEQQNVINFLTVEKFTGTEVGSMNLAYPDKWEGAYLPDNPQIQGKEYMIVKTKQGYFVTPGNGVKLPNGQIIGKDLILDENADIEAMIKSGGKLYFKGKALAEKMDIADTELTAQVWRLEE